MLEPILVILIVGAAALWLGRRFVRWARGNSNGECGGCGASAAKSQRATLTVGGRAVH